jgi:hypothetical protein
MFVMSLAAKGCYVKKKNLGNMKLPFPNYCYQRLWSQKYRLHVTRQNRSNALKNTSLLGAALQLVRLEWN